MIDWTSNETPTVEDSTPSGIPAFGRLLSDWFMVAGVFALLTVLYRLFAAVFPLE